jgi:N-dimethylarginine dimethylaminohydrolase
VKAIPTTRRTAGSTPLAEPWGIDSEYGVLRDVLLGPVDYFEWRQASALSRRTFRLGKAFDPDVARTQYQEMVDAYRQAGVTTHVLEPDPELPYQIYARDSSVMTPWGAVITQMYSPWRRGEWAAALDFYLGRDIPLYDVVTAGAMEGGDFVVVEPGLVVCGLSGERTSDEGLDQVRRWIETEGWQFKVYQFDPFYLHIDCQFAVLAERLAAVCTAALEPDFVVWLKRRGFELIDIGHRQVLELGLNVVALGNDRVLMPAGNDDLAAQCRAHGLEVLDPDLSMITPAGGGVHCICQPLRRDPVPRPPAAC